MAILWWHWLVLGLLLVVVEVTGSGGFYVMFFGVAALIVGVLARLDLAGPVWLQVLLFSLLSVGSLALFRSRLLAWLQIEPPKPRVDPIIGEIATVVEDLAPGCVGRVELRGTPWSARNSAHHTLRQGVRCRVVRVEGLMLHVEPEGAHA